MNQLNSVFDIPVLLVMLGFVIWNIFYNRLDGLSSELFLVLVFDFNIQLIILITNYFLPYDRRSEPNPPSVIESFRKYLFNQDIEVPRIFPLLILLNSTLYILNFLYIDFLVIWIIRNLVFMVLIIQIVRYFHSKFDFSSSVIKYPIAVIIVEGIRQLSEIGFLYSVQVGVMDLGLFPLLKLLGDIILIIIVGFLIYLENETEELLEFQKYEEEFAGIDHEYHQYSFTGFMAKLPSHLGRSKFYLKIMFSILIAFIVYLYIQFVMLVNLVYDPIALVMTAILVLLVGGSFYVIHQSRKEINEMMFNYSQVMGYFSNQNKELFDIINSDED